jgi:hypothetical protein
VTILVLQEDRLRLARHLDHRFGTIVRESDGTNVKRIVDSLDDVMRRGRSSLLVEAIPFVGSALRGGKDKNTFR